MAQDQARRPKSEADVSPTDGGTQARADKAAEDTDGLLDEIDSVLEENAEEFVKGYVQKGGQ
jgi:ubiquitin-like protein Pup